VASKTDVAGRRVKPRRYLVRLRRHQTNFASHAVEAAWSTSQTSWAVGIPFGGSCVVLANCDRDPCQFLWLWDWRSSLLAASAPVWSRRQLLVTLVVPP